MIWLSGYENWVKRLVVLIQQTTVTRTDGHARLH